MSKMLTIVTGLHLAEKVVFALTWA